MSIRAIRRKGLAVAGAVVVSCISVATTQSSADARTIYGQLCVFQYANYGGDELCIVSTQRDHTYDEPDLSVISAQSGGAWNNKISSWQMSVGNSARLCNFNFFEDKSFGGGYVYHESTSSSRDASLANNTFSNGHARDNAISSLDFTCSTGV